ncbi:ABC transporter permease [Segnochrobactrum spirostomi]|uniref:Autoinducer 2 import system permease protein LsrD n=1 Tax=Segnochrobactrum spirostomi TaxID=2608987 RepID=A0A6A7Y2J8_9HYPH|nr:ABC transporter permease [Segnochrobactrum spirostomi]MQT12597.1 ABC transporter permease [Segnochrobactrum spirostomi]
MNALPETTRPDEAAGRAAVERYTAPPSRLARIVRSWEFLLVVLFAAGFVACSLASPYFLDIWNLSDATFNFTEKAIVALPMALLIIGREIDISVAGIIALASVMMGLAAQAGAAWWIVALVGLGTGLACGMVNGALVTLFRVPAIVATIGTMSLYRGVGYAILGDQVIKSYPEGFEVFGQGYAWGPLSIEFAIFLGLAALFAVVLHRTVVGRRLFAIGNSPTVALFSGIAVERYRFMLFAVVGLASGLASVCLTSRLGSTRPSIAVGWELEIITMVVLGGVSILGGVGSILGVVLAALLMGLVTFGLGLLNVPGIVMQIVVGGLLIAVISVPVVLTRAGIIRPSRR